MAGDDTYVVDNLATGPETVLRSDDDGNDTLLIFGTYASPTSINLNWQYNSLGPLSASGFYYSEGTTGHRLVVTGQIENAIGSAGRDEIQGNALANSLYGDLDSPGGSGDNDTLFGGAGDDSLYGVFGDDWLNGAGDRDKLYGGTGADTLSGGLGNDTLFGGAGADSLSGGADGRDMVSYVGSTVGVRVSLTFGATTTGQFGHAAGDRINGFGDINGSEGADTLSDTNTSTLAFGYNNNRFYGNGGADILFMGGGSDYASGGTENDTISGGAGADILLGGAGSDSIGGGAGRDVLTGGTGADRFVFLGLTDSRGAEQDAILDFSRLQADKIDLSQIDAKTTIDGNQAFAFIGAAAFSGVAGQLQARYATGIVTVSADANGDGVADFSLTLRGLSSNLIATDFIL